MQGHDISRERLNPPSAGPKGELLLLRNILQLPKYFLKLSSIIKLTKKESKKFTLRADDDNALQNWIGQLRFNNYSELIQSLKETNKYSEYLKSKIQQYKSKLKRCELQLIEVKLKLLAMKQKSQSKIKTKFQQIFHKLSFQQKTRVLYFITKLNFFL